MDKFLVFHLNFVYMGPSRQASPSWCATFCRRALHGHWVVSAQCWTRPCFQGDPAGCSCWVGLNGLKKSKVTCNISKNEPVNLDICLDLTKSTHIFCCHQQNPWSMVSFDGGEASPSLPTGFQPFFQPQPSPSKAGIWDWLQEEAPQMLPSLLALVRQALPPAPEAAVFLGQVKQRKRNLLVS